MERNGRFSVAAVTIAAILSLAPSTWAKIIYVDANAPGLSNGSSWANAYRFLQDALADANSSQEPVEIRVAQGIYCPDRSSAHPSGTRDRKANFCLVDGIVIKGGFAGFGAPDPNARDIARYVSVLSGDLAGDDVPVADPCALLTEPTRAENSLRIVTAESCSRSSALDGFTIKASVKGAMYLSDTVPCRPSIRNCTFVDNTANWGAAATVTQGTEPEFIGCVFLRNVAAYSGGAIEAMLGRTMHPDANQFTIRGCAFIGNVALNSEGVYGASGGSISVSCGSPSIIEDCTFVGNSAQIGGAIYSLDAQNIRNCRFVQNTASQTGGAIYLEETSATIAACTFSGNMAPHGRGCYVVGPQARLFMTNTILWDGGDEIGISGQVQTSTTYCDVQGGWLGVGNINADPLFANPIHLDPNVAISASGSPRVFGDYHLKSQAGRWDPNSAKWVLDKVTSPCIDAGDPNTPVGDEPQPNGGRINMGAYGGTAEASKSYFIKP